MFPANLLTFSISNSVCLTRVRIVSIKSLTDAVFNFLCMWLPFFFFFSYNFPAQRSAQELPLVEKQSTDSFPVIGGKKMILTGHNFLQDSKVIFVEKAPGMPFQTRFLSAYSSPPPVLKSRPNGDSVIAVVMFCFACFTLPAAGAAASRRPWAVRTPSRTPGRLVAASGSQVPPWVPLWVHHAGSGRRCVCHTPSLACAPLQQGAGCELESGSEMR